MAAGADLLGGRDDRPLRLRQACLQKVGKGGLAESGGRAQCLVIEKRGPGRPNRTGLEAIVGGGSQYTGNRRYSAGTNGHDRYAKSAGRRICTSTTSAAARTRRRVRIPPAGCRGPGRPLANEAGVAGVGPHPAVKLVPTPPGPTNVVLVRRATTVPFTRAPTGPQRTTTDNTTPVLTCAVPHSPR